MKLILRFIYLVKKNEKKMKNKITFNLNLARLNFDLARVNFNFHHLELYFKSH